MSIESTFNTLVEQHHQPSRQIVLAFSGGLDSRVMLELMAHYCKTNQGQTHQAKCLAVHVHHGLSPNADEWARLCQQWCQQLGVEFVLEKVQLKTQGRSVEESAREARYHALKKHLKANDLLLTGQHADDQLETFFLALKRGSGPKGLSSMAQAMPMANATLLRPLLSISRQQIKDYALARGLDWIEDESNQDQRFERNFIRHSLTPNLLARWPHIRHSIQRTAELCSEQEALLNHLLADAYQGCLYQDGSLIIPALAPLSTLVRKRIIRMWLEGQQVKMPSREQLSHIWQQVAMAQADANPELTLSGGQVRRFSQRLYLVRQWQSLAQWQQSISFEQSYVLPDQLGSIMIKQVNNGHLSQQKLSQGELKIIFNPQGLSAHPVARGHSRQLKKLFQEYGVPSWLRRRTPILICDQNVVAVGELFIDRNFTGRGCEFCWDKETSFM